MPGLVLLGEETVRMEDPELPADKDTVAGLRDDVGPEGDTVAVRDRLPVSPLTLVRVMLELDDVPGGTVRELVLAEIVKSTTCTVAWIEWEREPLVAVTVTV